MALDKKTKSWLEANASPSVKGKTVLITGATGGVGLKTAEIMLYLGANVIMACRNLQKAERIKEKLLIEYSNSKIEIMLLDLADFSSIDSFIGRIEREKTDVDVFINNAGVFHKPGELTADGFDMVMGTNYLGVFKLTQGILPYLKTLPHSVFYINTVSLIHKIAKIDFGDFEGKNKGNFSVYGASKLCIAKYSYYISKLNKNTNVKIVMNHPGVTITELGINAFGKTVGKAARLFSTLSSSPRR